MARDSHLEYEGSVTTEPTTGQGWSRTFFFDELSLIARRPLSLSLSLFKFARLIRIKLSLSLSIAQFDYPYPSSHHYRPGFIVPLSITQSSPGIKTRPPSKHDWMSETERHMQNGVDRKGMRGYKKKTHKHQHHHHRLCRNTTPPPPNQPTFALHLGRLDRLA